MPKVDLRQHDEDHEDVERHPEDTEVMVEKAHVGKGREYLDLHVARDDAHLRETCGLRLEIAKASKHTCDRPENKRKQMSVWDQTRAEVKLHVPYK